MTSPTPWEAGRFDARGGPKKILFGRMYEDTAIEQAAFAGRERIFCIASAGCMAIELAAAHAVTAVDINPVQLAYAQQRAAGGPTQVGAAERVMALGRRLMFLVGWQRRRLESFLELSDLREQVAFWNRHLNNRPFRAATDILFSTAWLRLVYASPFLGILPPRFGAVMRARLARCWAAHANRSNPYARALLLGQAPAACQPPVQAIRFACTDAASYLESCKPGSFDGFTLSNILDGAPDAYRARLFRALRRAGTAPSVVVLRSFAEPALSTSANQAARDRSILWGMVHVHPVADLDVAAAS